MNRNVCIACVGLFALVIAAKAEDPVTVGFWTFDGENGSPVAETRDKHAFPNHITGAAPTLCLCYDGQNASSIAAVPLAIYTNDIQHAYLYGDRECTNRIATTSSSLYMKAKRGSKQLPYFGTSHPNLVVTNIGAAVSARSFTLEFISRQYYPLGDDWVSFLALRQNELGVNPLTVRMAGSSSMRVKLMDGSTERVSMNDPFLNMDYNHWVDDGDWHHFAIRWTESTKTMEILTDYSLVKSYTLAENDLLLNANSYFILFPYDSINNHEDVTVQAVRLTSGDLETKDFLQTSPHATPQTTLAHYRFEGVAGEGFVESRNLMLDRADLALFRPNVQSSPTGRPPAHSPLFETQGYQFLKNGKEYLKNQTGVRDNPDDDLHMRLGIRNRSYFLPESFTHEFLIKPALQVMLSGGSKILGERGAEHGDPNSQNGAWWVAQNSSSSAGLAYFLVTFRVWNGTSAENRYQPVYMTTNEWHHMALTYDAPKRVFKVYLDGVAKMALALAEGEELVRGTSFSAPIGSPDFNQNYGYVGSFDEWRVSNVALEPKDFLKMRKSGGGLILMLR